MGKGINFLIEIKLLKLINFSNDDLLYANYTDQCLLHVTTGARRDIEKNITVVKMSRIALTKNIRCVYVEKLKSSKQY